MDYRERIEIKVAVVFLITNQYLSGQIPLEQAKEQVNAEMASSRPAQFEAVKAELGKRLEKCENPAELGKMLELFINYLPLPFMKLQNGHPLRNYYEENSRVRSCILRMDEMEEEEVELDAWRDIYEFLRKFMLHIKRQEKNLYPLLIPFGMSRQVKKARELGDAIIHKAGKNQELLESGNGIDFLFYQRSIAQRIMNYLDLEERVLFPKALMSLNNQELRELRTADDQEGYVYIEQPADFVPEENDRAFSGTKGDNHPAGTKGKETGQVGTESGILLPALLATKDMGMIYYTLSGEAVFLMGKQLSETDMQISEATRQALFNGSARQKKYWFNQGNQTFLITYSLVKDGHGNPQGIVKLKEDISEIKALTGECPEGGKAG